MSHHPAIVNPFRSKRTPSLGPVAVMVSSQADLDATCRRLGRDGGNSRPLFTSRLYPGEHISLVGPFVGAPYAVMLLETLIAWGVDRIIFFGWCGAISPSVAIGDIVLPTAAIVDEGTSPHYGLDIGGQAIPSAGFLDTVRHGFAEQHIPVKEGIVWSTDAIYRETKEKVAFHQARQVLAVEMELSALFTVGRFRQADVIGVLVVSDELGSFIWRPGFKHKCFQKARADAATAIEKICRTL